MQADRPKQYLQVAGRSLIEHSLAVLAAPWVEGVIVVLSPDDTVFAGLGLECRRPLYTVTGGVTRGESVLAGLQRVGRQSPVAESVWVLVHDAARPCVTAADLERLRDEASDEHGGLLAVPVTDTLKRAEGATVAATVSRRDLWRAQTPQLFRLDLLTQALQACAARGVEVTDESAAMEAAGYRPKLVRGHERNLKVTYPEDLALAEYWLSRDGARP
jgi:2-C-methyl-D-erythritol 4-phosphate cytidylyltransferase